MFVRGGSRRDEGATPGGRVRWARGRCGVAWEHPDRCEGVVRSSAVPEACTGEAADPGRGVLDQYGATRGIDTRLGG